MAVKSTLQTLDGLDEALKAHYTQQGDVFVLDVEGIDRHPETASLKSAYERTKQDRDAIRAERDAARADLTAATKGKPDEAALIAERQAYEARIAELTGKLGEATGKLTGMTRDQSLKAALAEAGITNPTYLEASEAMLRDKVTVADDGSIHADTPMGPKSVADFVKAWVADKGKAFVTPPSGGGAKGAETGSVKALSDMTEQERVALHRINPAEYQRLKATG